MPGDAGDCTVVMTIIKKRKAVLPRGDALRRTAILLLNQVRHCCRDFEDAKSQKNYSRTTPTGKQKERARRFACAARRSAAQAKGLLISCGIMQPARWGDH